jgi:hypothetical protein
MSVRPNISGFNLSKLQSLAGCRDEIVLHKLEGLVPNDDEDRQEIRGIIQQYIMHGAPFPNLDAEIDLHCTAAHCLAHSDQTHTPTDSNIWKWPGALEDLAKYRKKADPELSRILSYLENGRPLFGRRIDGNPVWYAYLTHEELGLLMEKIKSPKVSQKEVWDAEYMDNLLAKGYIDKWTYDQEKLGMVDTAMLTFDKALAMWSKSFHDAGHDLWLFCT